MSDTVSPFRGYRGIELITQMIEPIIDWLLKYKTGDKHLTLHRKDYDLIARWPKAGKLLGFEYPNDGPISYKGVTLGYDKQSGRYPEKQS